MHVLQRIALALVIIGAVNWGLIGFFQFNLVAAIFGGETAGFSRIVYALVGLSGLICISFYFNEVTEDNPRMNRLRNLNYETEFAEDAHDDFKK